MGRFVLTCLTVLLLSGTGGLIAYQTDDPVPPTLIPLDNIGIPGQPVRGVVFLLSGSTGWGAREAAISAKLQAAGSAVVGVDTPQYLSQIAQTRDSCAYLIADVERISQQIQRESGSSSYVAPVVAGIGLGGGLALDMVDQTPKVTVGGTAVVDPVSAVPLGVQLCTPAGYLSTSSGKIYNLPSGLLVDPISILLSPNVPSDIRQRMESLKGGSGDVTLWNDVLPTDDAIAAMITRRVELAQAMPESLPVTVLSATPKHNAVAIILSGDGGWRDIDSTIGKTMQADGIPVIGIDSLRYFWSRRTPQKTASDIAALIRKYRAKWSVDNVILVGYSFGADVLPAVYLDLPLVERSHIRLVSLLGLSHSADWQITVSGWLGSHSNGATPTMPALDRMPAPVIQCVAGVDEANGVCAELARNGAEILITEGGHHFGGEYKKVEMAILSAYSKRVNRGVRGEPRGPDGF